MTRTAQLIRFACFHAAVPWEKFDDDFIFSKGDYFCDWFENTLEYRSVSNCELPILPVHTVNFDRVQTVLAECELAISGKVYV